VPISCLLWQGVMMQITPQINKVIYCLIVALLGKF